MEQVAGCFPPGPDRAHFRSLCRLTRRITNTCVTVAQVEGWEEAEQLGTRLPHLQQLVVRPGQHQLGQLQLGQQQPARNFLQHSAAQLTKLTSLKMGGGSPLGLDMIPLLCSNLTRLQRLHLAVVCNGATAVFKQISALRDMEDLALQVTFLALIGKFGVGDTAAAVGALLWQYWSW